MSQEIVNALFGTGFLIGLISLWLTFKDNKSQRRIDWYDRSIKEIERLETKLSAMETRLTMMQAELDSKADELEDAQKKLDARTAENAKLKKMVASLQVMVKDLRSELAQLKRGVASDANER